MVTMTTNDPVIRYVAGGILLAAFLACLAVVVHGYWYNADYIIPAVIEWVLASAVTGSLTLLGVHLGSTGMSSGVKQGANVVTEAKNGNGR